MLLKKLKENQLADPLINICSFSETELDYNVTISISKEIPHIHERHHLLNTGISNLKAAINLAYLKADKNSANDMKLILGTKDFIDTIELDLRFLTNLYNTIKSEKKDQDFHDSAHAASLFD